MLRLMPFQLTNITFFWFGETVKCLPDSKLEVVKLGIKLSMNSHLNICIGFIFFLFIHEFFCYSLEIQQEVSLTQGQIPKGVIQKWTRLCKIVSDKESQKNS